MSIMIKSSALLNQGITSNTRGLQREGGPTGAPHYAPPSPQVCSANRTTLTIAYSTFQNPTASDLDCMTTTPMTNAPATLREDPPGTQVTAALPSFYCHLTTSRCCQYARAYNCTPLCTTAHAGLPGNFNCTIHPRYCPP